MAETNAEPLSITDYRPGKNLKIGGKEAKTIAFHTSDFENIPEELLTHQELQSVTFNRCKFVNMKSVEQLKCLKLTELQIKECNLNIFPDALSKLHTLQSLNVSENFLKEGLPDSVRNFRSLEKLDISNCGLLFPQVLCKLKSLKELNIGRNDKIQNLPGALESLKNLETLTVLDCDLLGFPQVLCKLKSLKELYIRLNNKIQNLPGALENLTNLETLDLWGCVLLGFPQVLCKLKSLKELYIGWNDKIQNLPGELKNLTNLETLDVSGCGLTEFPKVLCKLKSLKTLYIGSNLMIHNLPEALEDLSNLKTLNVSYCGLTEFPQVGKLQRLQNLDMSNNPIKKLPRVIERCEHLEQLNISYSEIKEFPTVIFKMKNVSTVKARNVRIEVLEEDFIKLWSQRPTIFKNGSFQKIYGLYSEHFVKPPHAVVERGPEACMKFYSALKIDDAVNCSMINVTVMGETGAGTSSLIHSIKEGSSVLVHPSDRTVVVNTLEVKHEDVLLKIADFGGHNIYEMTCPLFLKSTKQVAIIAVKLSEYSENNHNELVTKWLTTAVSNMKNGSIYIVATQCDLCSEDEVRVKMNILKENIQNWNERELLFQKKLRPSHQVPTDQKIFRYFSTSSLNMEGLKNVQEFLSAEAKSNRSLLPKRWTDIYSKIYEQTGKKFIPLTLYRTLFRKTMPFPRNLLPNVDESLECLQFLHDTGMILWYGEKHENLRKIIFHDPSFPVSVLQCLFRHDLAETLEYDHEQFRQYFPSKSKFEVEVTRFTQTGILNPALLQCIWKEFEFSKEVFGTMLEMLTMLDLCYIDKQDADNMLRLPWFVQCEDMSFLKNLWPEKLPSNTLQYTLTYCFCHRIPGVIYERFCVRLHRHLQSGGHTRQDRRHAVYIEQNGVQILFQRHPHESEPNMQIHMRCKIHNLLQLQKLCLALHQDMDNLCKEYSGLYIDTYLVCPHCLLAGSSAPTKRPTTDIVTNCDRSLELVPCDPFTSGSIQIPAALIFLRLFDAKNGQKHLKRIQEFCSSLHKDKFLLFDELFLKICKHITNGSELHVLGNGLGLTYEEISSIEYNVRDINRAGYQALVDWRKKKSSEQMNEMEMKEVLETVLCSESVGMCQVVSLYF